MILGVVGFVLNTVSLSAFLRLGHTKPYYVIIIFETVTDLILCLVAIYSGSFLVTGEWRSVTKVQNLFDRLLV